ncbi:MAG: SLBB domain-containing protein, partial [Betaproteobacteria bacterium]
GDVVTLQRISAQFANAVTLRGNVASPLRYPFKPGMRVSDLIPEAEALIVEGYHLKKNVLVQYERRAAASEPQDLQPRLEELDRRRAISAERALEETRNLLPQINWEYASVERLNRGEVTTQLIPFNLGRAVRGRDPAHDLVLEPGDVVTIYSVNELPVPRERLSQFVRLSGEVNVPGVYQLKPGETLADLVQRAGGFAKGAYVFGTVFTRESTRVQQQANLEQAVRRFEAAAGSQASATLHNASNPEAQQAVQLQVAAQRASIERLRGLQASGRVALEMDPQRPQLPGIVLEDGDVINVPAQPSFVSVFGSVGNESSFIHRPGATVRDYLDRAGPTREADLDSAMLIRSDGTVLVNAAGRSAWGWGERNFMASVVNPGDSVFVPEKLDRRTALTQFMTGAKDWSQIFYQFGLGASAIRVLRNN